MRAAQSAIRAVNAIAQERDNAVAKLEPALVALKLYAIAEAWFASTDPDVWAVKGRHCLICGQGVSSLTDPVPHDIACLLHEGEDAT